MIQSQPTIETKQQAQKREREKERERERIKERERKGKYINTNLLIRIRDEVEEKGRGIVSVANDVVEEHGQVGAVLQQLGQWVEGAVVAALGAAEAEPEAAATATQAAPTTNVVLVTLILDGRISRRFLYNFPNILHLNLSHI